MHTTTAAQESGNAEITIPAARATHLEETTRPGDTGCGSASVGPRSLRERCLAVARDNLPSNVRMVLRAHGLYGTAYYEHGILHAPSPTTRKALYVFLHECGHFALHAGHRKPRYLKEYEAHQWAHARMKAAGMQVPTIMAARAKIYVHQAIRLALRRGAQRILAEAVQWAVSVADPCAKRILRSSKWLDPETAELFVG